MFVLTNEQSTFFRVRLTALVPFATFVRVVFVFHRLESRLTDTERRLLTNALFLLTTYGFRARGARALGALVGEPSVAGEMTVGIARFAAVLAYAHAVVEHLSGGTRAHFGRQIFATRFSGSQRLIVVARLFATGHTRLVQQP